MYLHTLTRLFAREDFIEYILREICNTCNYVCVYVCDFFFADFLYVEPDGGARGPKHVADMTIYSCVRRHLTVCLFVC